MASDGLTTKDLTRWFVAIAEHVALVRGAFVAANPKSNVKSLSQGMVRKLVATTADVFWSQDASDRAKLRPQFWSTLCILKLVADDVFVETLQTTKDGKAESDARNTYHSTIEDFVRANPFLFSESSQRTKSLYEVRHPSEKLRLDYSNLLAAAPVLLDNTKFVLGDAISRVLTLQETLRTTGTTSVKDLAPTPEASGTVGALFLLLQMYLSDLRDLGGPPTFPGKAWYTHALAAVQQLRETVLGFYRLLEREAIDAGDSARANTFAALGRTQLERLARQFSVRIEESAGLWSFRDRREVKRKGEVFGEARLLVGANERTERLMSYLGRRNPDGEKDLQALDVDSLVSKKAELVGNPVKVLGEIDPKGSKLLSLTTKKSVRIDLERMELLTARNLGVAVQIEGKLEQPKGKPIVISVNKVVRFAEAYFTPVGFPIRVNDMGREVPLSRGHPPPEPPLGLRPTWRVTTRALVVEAAREETDRISRTIVGQDRLLHDLLTFPETRKALGPKAKTIQPVDLHDHKTRGTIWRSLFTALDANDPNNSVDRLLEFIQRYLTHFTRHTLWNVRDGGPAYYDTIWPQSITGRALHDCGVYAVLVAYDLQRAIAGSTAVRMRFGFITFLNHIALVVYHNDRSFFVNNDVIHGPGPQNSGENDESRAEHALSTWGPIGFPNVYKVEFSVALVRVPRYTLTSNQSETSFKNALWKTYKTFAVWWGLQPGTAVRYHEEIADYDQTMHQLGALLGGMSGTPLATSDIMIEAAKRARALYDLAKSLADPRKFGERAGVKGKIKEVSRIGVIAPPRTSVPLYHVVSQLVAAKQRGDTLTTDQDALTAEPATLGDHADALNRWSQEVSP